MKNWNKKKPPSAEVPDWEREKLLRWWQPGRQLIRSIRKYQYWKNSHSLWSPVACAYHLMRYRFWTVITSTDIPLNCQIEGGLVMPHPNGIVIHPGAHVGVNCMILQQVTIVNGVRIGGHVDIGAGAKIIKAVSIGDHAKIGANAVVTTDVPERAIAVGIPARIIFSSETDTRSMVLE